MHCVMLILNGIIIYTYACTYTKLVTHANPQIIIQTCTDLPQQHQLNHLKPYYFLEQYVKLVLLWSPYKQATLYNTARLMGPKVSIAYCV